MLSESEQTNLIHARMLYYDFFNGFLVFEMLDERAELAQKQIEILLNEPLNDTAKNAMLLLQNELKTHGMANFKDEFSRLFALPFGAKQVGIHLSHFYHHCIGGESLLRMRQLVKQSDVRVQSENFKETEEHLGFICGFMRHLLEIGNAQLAKDVFALSKDAFLGFIAEIEAREDAKLYVAIAQILQSFIQFEGEYDALTS
ncbi:MAG: molecular chaperone TorD family protein [Helicobacter sp.]|nr:molecular chaperone TorD family protein [Helicobacter sp.]